jgi:hypothetical protein
MKSFSLGNCDLVKQGKLYFLLILFKETRQLVERIPETHAGNPHRESVSTCCVGLRAQVRQFVLLMTTLYKNLRIIFTFDPSKRCRTNPIRDEGEKICQCKLRTNQL